MKHPGHYYVAVRTDIPIEDQVCQVAHAARLAGKRFKHKASTHLVLLQVDNLDALENLMTELSGRVGFESHYEPDDDMGFTALATDTVEPESRKLFRKYRLWRFECRESGESISSSARRI